MGSLLGYPDIFYHCAGLQKFFGRAEIASWISHVTEIASCLIIIYGFKLSVRKLIFNWLTRSDFGPKRRKSLRNKYCDQVWFPRVLVKFLMEEKPFNPTFKSWSNVGVWGQHFSLFCLVLGLVSEKQIQKKGWSSNYHTLLAHCFIGHSFPIAGSITDLNENVTHSRIPTSRELSKTSYHLGFQICIAGFEIR
jgi:hypothetical protein